MDVYVDTEFIDDGSTLDLISVGMVRADGPAYYAVNADLNINKIARSDFLTINVWPQLPQVRGEARLRSFSTLPGWASSRVVLMKRLFDKDAPEVKMRRQIATEVAAYFNDVSAPRMWGWDCAYDRVVLGQLWGARVKTPPGVPWFMGDLRQEVCGRDIPGLPQQIIDRHHALANARHIAAIHRLLQQHEIEMSRELRYDTAA